MSTGRKILLTGGTSGIGLSMVRTLCQRHGLLVTGRKLSPDLEVYVNAFPGTHFLALDQIEPAQIPGILNEKLAGLQWHGLDNAILNAGTGFVSDPAHETASAIRQTLDVNLTANLTLAHTLFPYLKRNRGKLSLIGSTARKGAPTFASYAASKAGLHGLARALKEEWRGQVKVQAIHPGPTRTDMHKKAGLKLGVSREFFADPDSMAKMIETQIASPRFTSKLGLLYFWAGGAYTKRRLR